MSTWRIRISLIDLSPTCPLPPGALGVSTNRGWKDLSVLNKCTHCNSHEKSSLQSSLNGVLWCAANVRCRAGVSGTLCAGSAPRYGTIKPPLPPALQHRLSYCVDEVHNYHHISLCSCKISISNKYCYKFVLKKKQLHKAVLMKKQNYLGVSAVLRVQKKKKCKDLLGTLVSTNPSPPKYWAWDLWRGCANPKLEWSWA